MLWNRLLLRFPNRIQPSLWLNSALRLIPLLLVFFLLVATSLARKLSYSSVNGQPAGRHAVGCANGTDALELILRSLDLPAGSRVLAPSHTAVATVAAIVRSGHRPILADVDAFTYGLDPLSVARCFDAANAEGDPVRAVIAVHLYGHPVDLDALQELCTSQGIPLVEDGSQAHGARWRGVRVGSFGVAAGFSLYPTKNLGALGDAGVITCRSSDLAARLKRLRQYGWEQPAISEEPGVNSRLDPLQAAILRAKLPLLEATTSSTGNCRGLFRAPRGAGQCSTARCR